MVHCLDCWWLILEWCWRLSKSWYDLLAKGAKLNSDSSKDMAGEGLEYFLTNFSRDQSYIISRHSPEIQEQLQCLEGLLNRVLPDDLTYVTNERNPAGHRPKTKAELRSTTQKRKERVMV